MSLPAQLVVAALSGRATWKVIEGPSVDPPTIDPRCLESSAAVMEVLGIDALEPIFPEAMVSE